MQNFLIDSNIFCYALGKDNKFKDPCVKILENLKINLDGFFINAEIAQELMYIDDQISKKELKRANLILDIFCADNILPITVNTIQIALNLRKKYPNLKARDSIHASSIIENKIDYLITIDKDFLGIKEIKIMSPEKIRFK